MARSRIALSWDRFAVVAAQLLLLGAALRLWLLVDASPAFLGYPDSGAYIAAATGLSASEFQPAGYSVFLQMGHLISGRLAATVLVQHLLGLATAVLYLDGLRRVARVRWMALIPTVFVLFDGLQLFFEHTVMSEVVFVALVAVAMYAAVRLLVGRWLPWTVLMVAACGLAVAVRAVALPLIVVLAVWLALVRPEVVPGLVEL